jgi:peptide/nickel transport system substrate-binding protein
MKQIKTLLALVLVLAFALSACGGAQEPAETAPEATEAAEGSAATEEAAPASGGTVIIGTPQEPGMMNTLLTSASIEDAVTSLFVEGLVSVNEIGEYVPVLAKELPTVSEDGLVVTWLLKEGI